MESTLTSHQKKNFTKEFRSGGTRYRIEVRLRYDDQYGNGHNSFSITGYIDEYRKGRFREHSGGHIHEEIEKYFPEFKHLIKWHLFDSTGPMHYVANTIYHARDTDCRGLKKDEKRHLTNGKTGLPVWQIVTRNKKGEEENIHLVSWTDSKEKPKSTFLTSWEPVYTIGEGSNPNLEAARSRAVWPEATLEQLRDKKALLARLPGLIETFKKEMEGLGFVF